VFETGSPNGRPARSHCVRFSFEAASLQKAVDFAGELRRLNPTGVEVRPARVSAVGAVNWAVQVTTPPLEASRISPLEDEMRRIAWRAPGITLTGWLFLSG
jgi:hypothetical protein